MFAPIPQQPHGGETSRFSQRSKDVDCIAHSLFMRSCAYAVNRILHRLADPSRDQQPVLSQSVQTGEAISAPNLFLIGPIAPRLGSFEPRHLSFAVHGRRRKQRTFL
jgi:hypothetical protein